MESAKTISAKRGISSSIKTIKTGTIAIERGSNTIYDNNKLREEYNYGKNVL
mgnify:CR=1 FL=1